jgi:hypothetical protein
LKEREFGIRDSYQLEAIVIPAKAGIHPDRRRARKAGLLASLAFGPSLERSARCALVRPSPE